MLPHDAATRKTSKISKLAHFSLKDQKVIVRYLFHQEIESTEIHKLIMAVCGELAPSYKEVREWITDMREGRDMLDMCVCDGGRKKTGLPGEATEPALVTRLEFLINRDPRISLDRLSDLSIASVQTIQGILISLLGLKSVADRWVPRIWTPEQREYRIAVCQQMLELYNNEGQNLMNRLIVGDDSFVLYHKNQSPGNGGKFRPADEGERVYCHFFYDSQGILLADMQESSEPLTSEQYISLIKNNLIPAWNRKRNNPSIPFYLLQSVTPVHNSMETLTALREMDVIVLPHAPSSPDLDPIEFWLFRILKKNLDSLYFQNRTDLWTAVKGQIHAFTEVDFGNSISRLADRWSICVDKQGLYLL